MMMPSISPGGVSSAAATRLLQSVRSFSSGYGLELSSILAFAAYGAAAGISYLAQLVIARIVGVTSYGCYAYVLAWITILAYGATVGFDVALLRLVASYRARRAWALAKGAIRYAERRVVACGVVLTTCGMLLVLTVGKAQSFELKVTFLLGLTAVPLWALLWVRAAIVRAFGGVLSALMPDRLVRDGLLLVLVWLAARLWHGNIDARLVMAATLASSLVGLVLVSVMKGKWRPAVLDTVEAEVAAPLWRRTAVPLLLIALAESAMNRTGVVLLGWEGQTSEAGIFALIFNITSIVILPRVAVNTRFAPMVAELFTHGDRSALQALNTRATAWSLAGGALIALPLSVLGGWILSQFGREFQIALLPMQILLVSQLVAAGAGSQIFLMTMTGHERAAAVIMVCSAIGAAMSLGLIYCYSITGAAIATTLTLVIMNVAMAIFVRRHLGLVMAVVAIAERRLSPNML
jgi:O-antigen/teichoic acid export membrane protein